MQPAAFFVPAKNHTPTTRPHLPPRKNRSTLTEDALPICCRDSQTSKGDPSITYPCGLFPPSRTLESDKQSASLNAETPKIIQALQTANLAALMLNIGTLTPNLPTLPRNLGTLMLNLGLLRLNLKTLPVNQEDL